MNKRKSLFASFQKFVIRHRDFFIILSVVATLVALSRFNRSDLPGTTTFIEIEQLPGMYQMDTSRLRVEIFHLKTSKDKRIPRVLPVRFHLFNFDGASSRWYLTKSDFQDMLREFTVIRIEPDTVWFSPWYSEVRKLAVRAEFDVPYPFELVEATIVPDSIPLLFRGRFSVDEKEIFLGKISTRKDLRFQTFTFSAKDYLPPGTATHIQSISVKAEIGQWKPIRLTIPLRTTSKIYQTTIYAEIPVTDSLLAAEKCIRISPHGSSGYKAQVKECSRIRNVKPISIHARD